MPRAVLKKIYIFYLIFQTGEILIRGPQVMRGYRDNPQANNEAFTADGWFRTGDLAIADEEGILTIADRLKELIKVSFNKLNLMEVAGQIEMPVGSRPHARRTDGR